MPFTFTQLAAGVAVGSVLAVGTWGVRTEVTNRTQNSQIQQNVDGVNKALSNDELILQQLYYIRGKVDIHVGEDEL